MCRLLSSFVVLCRLLAVCVPSAWSALPVSSKSPVSSSSLLHRCFIAASSLLHRCFIVASSLLHFCFIVASTLLRLQPLAFFLPSPSSGSGSAFFFFFFFLPLLLLFLQIIIKIKLQPTFLHHGHLPFLHPLFALRPFTSLAGTTSQERLTPSMCKNPSHTFRSQTI